MRDPSDFMAYGVGVYTAGVGFLGITMEAMQATLSIVASVLGIVLTALTLWWRRAEHKRRVKEFEDYAKRLERLERDE